MKQYGDYQFIDNMRSRRLFDLNDVYIRFNPILFISKKSWNNMMKLFLTN
jgi:hypothetical protein